MRPVDPSVVVARLVGDECRVAVERVAMVCICVPPNAPARIWIWIPRRAAQRRRAGWRGAGWPLLACGIAGRDRGARVQQLLVERTGPRQGARLVDESREENFEHLGAGRGGHEASFEATGEERGVRRAPQSRDRRGRVGSKPSRDRKRPGPLAATGKPRRCRGFVANAERRRLADAAGRQRRPGERKAQRRAGSLDNRARARGETTPRRDKASPVKGARGLVEEFAADALLRRLLPRPSLVRILGHAPQRVDVLRVVAGPEPRRLGERRVVDEVPAGREAGRNQARRRLARRVARRGNHAVHRHH